MSRSTRPINQLDAQGRVLTSSGDWTTFRGEYTGTNLIYAGFAKPGAAEGDNEWQISKMTYDASGNILTVKWPTKDDGTVSSDFEFNWTGRAGYVFA